MHITRVEAEGVFSFGTGDDHFALEFGDHLTVLVGPNASGKSNVSRIIDLVHTVARYEYAATQGTRAILAPVLDDLAISARHDEMPPSARSTIRLGIRLRGTAEVALMTAYIQVLVLAAMFGNQTLDEESLSGLEAWVAEQVTPDAIVALLDGTILVSHSGVPGTQWNLGYEFNADERPIVWHLTTPAPNLANVIAPRGPNPTGALPAVATLTQRLIGDLNPPPRPIPPPTTPFSLRALLPDSESLVRVEMPNLNANFAPKPHRQLVDGLGIEVSRSDPLGPYRRSYSLAAVLSILFDHGLRYLGPSADLLAHASYTLDGPGSLDAAASTIEGRLHQLKNGDQHAQLRYREIQHLFTALAPGRSFELKTRRRAAADQESEPVTEIEVFPEGVDRHVARARPLRAAGTGVEQAVILAEALASEPDRVLVLDEPATNLHPAWQRIVRTQLGSRNGQCLLVTHSPYLVPAEGREQLGSLVRLSVSAGATRVHRLATTDLADERWIGTMVKELAWSADARGLLFASGVVLVEGQTELAALPAWISKSPNAKVYRQPDDLDMAFHSVGSDQNFQPFLTLLERFGVPWAVIADGAAFRFDIHKHVFEQIMLAGVVDPVLERYIEQEGIKTKAQASLTPELFRTMADVGQQHGVFTLAGGWHRKGDPEPDDESFEAFVTSLPALRDAFYAAVKAAPKSKPRAGRLLAEATDCPSVVNGLYLQLLTRLWDKGMPRLSELAGTTAEVEPDVASPG